MLKRNHGQIIVELLIIVSIVLTVFYFLAQVGAQALQSQRKLMPSEQRKVLWNR
jgi:hypothetical protein